MNSYIIFFETIMDGYSSRQGYSIVEGMDKDSALYNFQRNFNLFSGEELEINRIEMD
jgi:hypothetical protein